MIFKNFITFKLTQPIDLNEFASALSEHPTKKIGSTEESSTGFISPHRQYAEMFYPIQQFGLFAVKHQQKTIPASIVKEQLEEKMELIKSNEGRHITAKERLSIKEELVFSLLPKVLARIEVIHAFIDTESHLLVINSSSIKKAELVVELIRKALGPFPVIPLKSKQPPQSTFTYWLNKKKIPHPFSMGDKLFIKSKSEESASLRCSGLDFFSDEVRTYLENDFFVESLSLDYKEQILFAIDQQITFKQIKFTDSFVDQIEQLDDDLAEFEQNSIIYFNAYIELIHQVISALGGVNEHTENLSESNQQNVATIS